MNNLGNKIKNQAKEENKSVVRCCRYCSSFHMTNEGNYTLFECDSLPIKAGDAYSKVLHDIGWSNFDTTISKYCPLNKRS